MGTFSNDGYLRDRTTTWQAALKALYYSIFGTDIDLSDDAQDGQIIGAMAEALANQDQQVEFVSKVCNPDQAQGSYLSTLVRINGITRRGATKATVVLTLTGTNGTVIPAGSRVQNASGDQFETDADVTISSGTASVSATAVVAEYLTAAAGSVTTIVDNISGWTAVTNANDAVAGADEESDTDLRIRRRASVALAATGNVQALYGALLSLDNVTDAVVKENFTGSTDSDGITEHSVACIIEGGTYADIAETILNTKSAGCDMFGSITETVTDSQGFDVDVKFSRPEDINIFVTVGIDALADYPDSGDTDIAQAIEDYFTSIQAIGEDVIYSKVYNPVNTIPGVSVTSLTIGRELVQTLTFDADLVTDNVINGKSGGVAIAPVTFATDHDTTMASIATAITTANAKIDTAAVTGGGGSRVITVTSLEAEMNQPLTDWIVTLGATQSEATVADVQGTVSIAMAFDQIARFDTSRITINSTPA